MEDFSPIPVPRQRRLQVFRESYLPIIVFVALVLVITWMWGRYVQPASIIGEVEVVRANIVSTVDGTIQEIKVDYLQAVTNGQELVVLSVAGAAGEMAVAEADLRLMKVRMDLDRTRNLDSYSRLRTDFILEQSNLELARVRLKQADAEFERSQKLFDDKLISRSIYDLALRDRDALREEIAAREKTVAELQRGVERMQATDLTDVKPTDDVIEQGIAAQGKLLELNMVLRSPIDGFVSSVSNRPGEKVMAGSPILVVSGAQSDRIVAWVQRPVTVRPQPGDLVEVRRTMFSVAPFEASVLAVGGQLEPISPTAYWPIVKFGEVGLPLLIKSPKVLEMIPGEPIQIRIKSSPLGSGGAK